MKFFRFRDVWLVLFVMLWVIVPWQASFAQTDVVLSIDDFSIDPGGTVQAIVLQTHP